MPDLLDGHVQPLPGIIDQDVDAAEACYRLLDQSLDLRQVTHVRLHYQRVCNQLASQRLQRLHPARCQNQARPRRRSCPGRRLADPRRSAGDNHDFAV
jgi:hypothetical protein